MNKNISYIHIYNIQIKICSYLNNIRNKYMVSMQSKYVLKYVIHLLYKSGVRNILVCVCVVKTCFLNLRCFWGTEVYMYISSTLRGTFSYFNISESRLYFTISTYSVGENIVINFSLGCILFYGICLS